MEWALREAERRLKLWAASQRHEIESIGYPKDTPYLRDVRAKMDAYRIVVPDMSTEDDLEASRAGWVLICMAKPDREVLVRAVMDRGKRGRAYRRALGIFARLWSDWCPVWDGCENSA